VFRLSRTGTRTPSTGNWSTGSGKECDSVSVHKNTALNVMMKMLSSVKSTTVIRVSQVRIWRSSSQGQGHGSKKVQHLYSSIVKLWSAKIAFFNTQSHEFAWNIGFWVWQIEWCDRYLRHVTGSDHAWLNARILPVVGITLEGTILLIIRFFSKIVNNAVTIFDLLYESFACLLINTLLLL